MLDLLVPAGRPTDDEGRRNQLSQLPGNVFNWTSRPGHDVDPVQAPHEAEQLLCRCDVHHSQPVPGGRRLVGRLDQAVDNHLVLLHADVQLERVARQKAPLARTFDSHEKGIRREQTLQQGAALIRDVKLEILEPGCLE